MEKIDVQLLKNEVFVSVYFLIKNRNTENREIAKLKVLKLANAFHIELKKTRKYDLQTIFDKFLKNNSGYKEILPKLYNSL